MRRSSSYDKLLSKQLHNPKFAQAYFLEITQGEECLSIEDGLKHLIEKMGLKEYAELSGVARPNIILFLKGKRKLKPDTLDQYLKPFHLKVKMIVEKAS